MAEKHEYTPDKNLFEAPVSNESDVHPVEQAQANLDTLNTLLMTLPDHIDLVEYWRDIVGTTVEHAEQGAVTQETIDTVTRITVGLLDQLLVDEIAAYHDTSFPTNSKINQKAEYARGTDNPIPHLTHELPGDEASITFMTKEEARLYAAGLYSDLFPRHVHNTIEQLQAVFLSKENMFFLQFVNKLYTLDQAKEKLQTFHYLDDASESWACVMPIQTGNLYGFLQLTKRTPDDSINVSFPITGFYSTQSTIPKQDIWHELLRNGLPVFPSPNKHHIASHDTSIVQRATTATEIEHLIMEFLDNYFVIDNPDDAIIPRKVRASWIRQEKSIAERAAQTASFYQREFGAEFRGKKPQTIITRSGVSAIETAVTTAIEIAANNQHSEQHIYKLPGWYPENAKVREEIFTHEIENATILLINHDSNYPNLGNQEDYAKRRDRILEQFLQNATNNPDTQYAIVYDKTTDLSYHVFDHHELPDNVTYIEAASLTKHQRGMRHGFYGVLWNYGKEDIAESHVYRNKAAPTEYTVATFPHITAAEHQRIRESFIQQNTDIRRRFEDIFSQSPYQWGLETYPFYTFIIPPYQDLFQKFLETYKPPDGEEDLPLYATRYSIKKAFRAYLQSIEQSEKALENIVFNWTERNPQVEAGDSYGLKNIRATMFRNPMELPHENDKDFTMPLAIARVSHGLDINQKDTLFLFEKLFSLLCLIY